MELFHTSPNPIDAINSYGMLGECLCFSTNVYQMAACKVLVYKLEVSEHEIIEARSFFYRDDYEKLDRIVANVMELADCNEEQAQEFLSQNDHHHDAEIDWRIQGYAGEAAKVLGFRACKAQDEQGAVYIVPMYGREADLILIE